MKINEIETVEKISEPKSWFFFGKIKKNKKTKKKSKFLARFSKERKEREFK